MDNTLKSIINNQIDYFNSRKTLNINFRIQLLKSLKKEIELNEKEIENALNKDLGKSNGESYLTEIWFVYSEIKIALKNIKKWVKRKPIRSSLLNFPSSDFIVPEPYGNTLHISPWNYPFQLSIAPLVGAIAAGNTVLLKPSEYSINTSIILEKILAKVFDDGFVKVVQGGPEVASKLLEFKWNYIFFTGSITVGKIVAQQAAKHLTPVTLELGGKNPCVIDETASIKVTAKRIVWGKFTNCGQTCIAPDFLIVNRKIKEKLIKEIINQLSLAYSNKPIESIEYGRIISEKHMNYLSSLLEDQKILYGGHFDIEKKYFEPTIIEINNFDSKLMKEEIFGPILPIVEYDNFNEVDEIIKRYTHPLAMYIFTKNIAFGKKFLESYPFGGGAINDTVVHIANDRLPFGGVGSSGMGKYHGKSTFETFSHYKPYISRPLWIDPPLRYPPFKNKINFMKKILKMI
ncbi:MAG: aldehyde dehydrogenase [Flavobacteriaceae bacterium]|jgi:aldehyde dehydrogenase (NAD+)|nr:aldehyde dehydrogenase [Flavobacteriaceae bacterium]MBT3753405.1 aldehyde dehydrogenase [Flavobacteriaceae bacterium]MBT3794839.1 aldehyde dehydrogenase [Flavobacteriaceae bacterium]MBT4415795.1 aldehyde dehydrogenase [Flavobacteriaceae bacterium]MBT5012644.1 aldehyde dehydrogenase [Flavobacteriaceae bacterium]